MTEATSATNSGEKGGRHERSDQQYYLANGLPDCASLDTLTLEAIRENVSIRFQRTPQEIYTWVGTVLISINPYRPLNYDDSVKKQFLESQISTTQKSPHIFGLGQQCYIKAIRTNKFNNNETEKQQTVIVTGESGAGKTEACRHLVNFLIFASINAEQKKVLPALSKEIRESSKVCPASSTLH